MTDFVECDTCRPKPGHPLLCEGCRTNRATIAELEKRIESLAATNLKLVTKAKGNLLLGT